LQVKVLRDGLAFEGKRYQTLSAVAKAIWANIARHLQAFAQAGTAE
jgi:hypothetical protein